MKRVIAFFFMTVSLVVLSGCETAKGLGKDLSKLGDSIEKAASK